MKLKLGELRPIMDTLPVVLKKDLPGGKTSYWLARAFVDLQKEFKVLEETRKKLIDDKHGKRYTKDKKDKGGKVIEKKGDLVLLIPKDEKGNQIGQGTYVMKDMEKFNKDYAEVAEQEVEIKYEPRPIDDFIIKDKDGNERNVLTGIEILGLGRLIKEE